MQPSDAKCSRQRERVPLYRFAAPRYWLLWIGLSIIRIVNFLPLHVQLRIGGAIGRLVCVFDRRVRRIAAINVGLCLPELDPVQQNQLVRDHFASLGCALFETGMVWWASHARLRSLISFEGMDHLEKALEDKRGALLLSAHFTTLEMGACGLTLFRPTSIMYMTPLNPLIAELSRRGRARHTVQAISSDQIRDLIQNLKSNLPVWYAPDQRFTDKNSELVPLFGQPAASNVATSRLARISRAPVLPYFSERRADKRGYVIRICPPLDNFPAQDAVADTRRFHELIEAQVLRSPEQYLWAYKRFKHDGFDPYSRVKRRWPRLRWRTARMVAPKCEGAIYTGEQDL